MLRTNSRRHWPWQLAVLAACALPGLPLSALGRGPTGELTPCPRTPNCAATTATGWWQRSTPWPQPAGELDPATRMSQLVAVVMAHEDSEIITLTADYLHAEFTIGRNRFIDDVEFLLLPDGTTQARSASRVGLFDFGANFRRLEQLKQIYRDKFLSRPQ